MFAIFTCIVMLRPVAGHFFRLRAKHCGIEPYTCNLGRVVNSGSLAPDLLIPTKEGINCMLWYAWVFLVIAIIAAILGFGGIAAASAGIAKICFIIFIVLFLISLLVGRRRTI